MALNPYERERLDRELTPFRRGEVIASIQGDLIGVFESVGYHGGNPDIDGLGNYIFAEFEKGISKQGSTDWRVINSPMGDDDTYIDRRKLTLAEGYRLATEEEKELMEELLSKAEKNGDVTREMFDDQLSKLQAMGEKLGITIKIEE